MDIKIDNEQRSLSISEVVRKIYFICISSIVYFIAIGMGVVPFTLIINDNIAHNLLVPNANSIMVTTSVILISALTKFITSIYNSALSDYVGRKPLAIASIFSVTLGRVLILNPKSHSIFYISAFVSATFDCYYGISIAWVCDIVDPSSRGIALGILGGCLGFAFTIGVPIGAYISTTYSPYVAMHMSVTLLIFCGVLILLIPTDDTLGTHSSIKNYSNTNNTTQSHTKYITICRYIHLRKRHLPPNLLQFITEYSPLKGLYIIYDSMTPLDWVTNYLFQISLQILQTNLLQFGFLVFEWSSEDAGMAFSMIGVGVSISSLVMLRMFSEYDVVYISGVLSIVGFAIYSIAGSGIASANALSYPGLIFIAIGGSWNAALQSILTKQYPRDKQGEASGVLSQQGVFAILPAYLGGISFSVFIRSDSPIYWPGSAFALVCIHGYTSYHSLNIL
jgi:DHA1 family tetracycline resistance protein-like MFS transporter